MWGNIEKTIEIAFLYISNVDGLSGYTQERKQATRVAGELEGTKVRLTKWYQTKSTRKEEQTLGLKE